MISEDKPLSLLVAQGWEVVGFASPYGSEGQSQTFLLRKQKAHKILQIRTKYMGSGYVVKEMDV